MAAITLRRTDPVLRRVAYGLMAFCAAGYLAAIAFEILNQRGQTAWGTGSLVVDVSFSLTALGFPVVGLLITHREPRNRIGWLMLAIGVAWAWSVLADGYVLYGASTAPGSLPRPDVVAALSSWSWIPAIGLMGVFLILLFPDGHLPSPRWRYVAWVAAASIVLGSVGELFRTGTIDDTSVKGITNPLGIGPLSTVMDVLVLTLTVLPVSILVSAVALVVRFRRSRGVERLQLKWLATAGAFVAATYFLAMATSLWPGNADPTPVWVLALEDLSLVSFVVIPLAIGVAILKHRLYGIDVVINKSLVFGTLATFITTVYVAIVVGVGALVGRGGQPNLVLSIAATAVVAVAFQPVRDKVQRVANHLVYGARATPYEVLSDFADRMGGTFATADLLPVMARTVAQGVGAARVEVWLAGGPGLVREATWPSPTTEPERPAAVPGIGDLRGDRVVAVRHRGELLGALTVLKPPGEPVTPAEEKLLDDLAAQAGLVLRNVRLVEDLRGSRQRLVSTQDEERRRLERNLHDGAQQSLVAVALMLRMIRARLGDAATPAGSTLDEAAEQLGLAIEELRELARGIHPVILTERGLGPAIASLAERAPVPVVVDYRLGDRLSREVEGTLYYVVAEALANVAKHAAATEVQVRVLGSAGGVRLEVSDDGVGGADPARGSGLRGLIDRVSVVGGSLDVESPAGGGTRLVCTLPRTSSPRASDSAPDESGTAIPLGAVQ
ncbi:MAG: histidine kinase [Nocardioidaceae bacterium]